MLTKQTIETLLQRIRFDFFEHPFYWTVMEKDGGFLIRVSCNMRCVNTGKIEPQDGGKHYISCYATDNEVIFKAFKACKDFVDHELHESFYVDGVRVFDPHLNLDSLIDSVRYMKRTTREGSYTPTRIMENM